MVKPNRKITWVHVTYERDNVVNVVWVTQRWKKGKYTGKHRTECTFGLSQWTKLQRLLNQVRYSKWHRYTLPAYNGWSVCFEVTPLLMLV